MANHETFTSPSNCQGYFNEISDIPVVPPPFNFVVKKDGSVVLVVVPPAMPRIFPSSQSPSSLSVLSTIEISFSVNQWLGTPR